jgi:2-dehydro-3-deoxyphosphogluconate aldolase / (4S)-4-hydroxy-2-oxoglutarate aldolase
MDGVVSKVATKGKSMANQEVLQGIQQSGMIAILRHECEVFVEEHLPELIRSGLSAIEISFSIQNPQVCLSRVVKQHGDALIVGAGTILSKDQALQALDYGARFLISPHLNEELAEFVIDKEVPYIAGCFTPTEVARAVEIGVDAVKIFPAFIGGPRYIAALRAPFPLVRFVPTGGISPLDAPTYWQAGAWAVAIGSELQAFMEKPDATTRLSKVFDSHLM